MWEIVGTMFGGPLLEPGELSAVLWFGVGFAIGLVVAVASVAACALECVGKSTYRD